MSVTLPDSERREFSKHQTNNNNNNKTNKQSQALLPTFDKQCPKSYSSQNLANSSPDLYPYQLCGSHELLTISKPVVTVLKQGYDSSYLMRLL